MQVRPVLALALAFAAGACERPVEARVIDPSLVAISAQVTVRTDTVGVDRFASLATFALVDRDRAARPTATIARIDLRGARAARFAPEVTITDGHVYRDGDRAVIAGQVHNATDRPCIAMVLAGFHDQDGRPMTRPFAAFELGANAVRPTRFVGPDGSRAGYIFVGDVTYCPRSGCTVERVAPTLW